MSRSFFAITALLLLLAGCQCGPAPAEGIGPAWEVVLGDAGTPVVPPNPVQDAGVTYSNQWAGEACPVETFAPAPDAGNADAAVSFGLCVALRTLDGKATLNGKPVTSTIQMLFDAAAYRGEIVYQPNSEGRFEIRAMRSRYDILKYHPDGIFPTHLGYEEFGVIDMTRNQTRDVAVNSHRVRGGVSFGGAPWASLTFPPDVRIAAYGLPPVQTVAASNNGGSYEVALMEGVFGLGVSVPRDALGETEIIGYPVSPSIAFNSDTVVDIHIPAAEFRGTLLIDGQPFPRRTPGFDYELEYLVPGSQSPLVRTYHQGGVADFRGLVPKGKYAVVLAMEAAPDPELPSAIFNKQLAQTVDLNQDATGSFVLSTVRVEGVILIDGTPIPTAPNSNSFFYFYDLAQRGTPPTLAYYEVPMTSATFNLKAFPATYYVALYVNEGFHPDLTEGWFLVDRQKAILADTQMPVDIVTSTFEGRLYVDGAPALEGKTVGNLVFQGPGGFYRKRLSPGADGSFRMLVPKGRYDVFFEIDPSQYPEYATGRHRLVSGLDLQSPQVMDLHYNTWLVHGPLRVGGEPVVDRLVGYPEVGLTMRRVLDNVTFTWTFHGGSPDYLMRVPKGEYELNFRIYDGAMPGVAHGTAPMGVRMKVQ